MSSILVFRIGSLGDTLVALPALWRIREHFRCDTITLLCDHPAKGRYVLAADLLNGIGIADHFLQYSVDRSQNFAGSLAGKLATWTRVLAGRFDTIVYLARRVEWHRTLRGTAGSFAPKAFGD